MPERIIVKINENDNVAVAIHDLPAEAEFLPGLKPGSRSRRRTRSR